VSPEAPVCRKLDACPICRCTRSRERFSSPDLLRLVPGVFRYAECEACRTIFQDPRVVEEDLPACYPAGYFTHEADETWSPTPAPPGSVRDRVRRAIRAADGVPDPTLSLPLRLTGAVLAVFPGLRRRARFELVDGLEPPVAGGGRCLEVGPGGGLDLLRLRLLGWRAEGLEIDPISAERAGRTSGCEVRVGTLFSADYPAGCFDLVYMSHVFEHLPDPSRALGRCLELLAPAGRLVLVYPNPQALTVRLFDRFSCVFEPPRHLVLAPVEAVAALLGWTGFVDVRAETSARHAAAYLAASRDQRSGTRWDWRRPRPPTVADRLLGATERALVAVGRPLGEEVIVRARRP
jgi:SAM-dependent methyltransferase